ncbi:MAG: hypothetical protein AAF771_10420 [Pseudomonadota bacterium]
MLRFTAHLATATLIVSLAAPAVMVGSAPAALAQPQQPHTTEKFGDFLKRMFGRPEEPAPVQRRTRYVPRHAPAVSLVPMPKPGWLRDPDYSSHWEGLTAVNASRAEFFRAQPNSRVGRLRTYYLEYLEYERFMAEQEDRDAYRATLEAAKLTEAWTPGTTSPEIGREIERSAARLETIEAQIRDLDETFAGLLASDNTSAGTLDSAAGAVTILREALKADRDVVKTEVAELRAQRAVAIAAETFGSREAIQRELDQITLTEAVAEQTLKQALKLAAGPSSIPEGEALEAFNRLLKEKLGTDDMAVDALRDISGLRSEDAEPPRLQDKTQELAAAFFE